MGAIGYHVMGAKTIEIINKINLKWNKNKIMLRTDHNGSQFHNCATMTTNDLERKGPSRREVLCHLECLLMHRSTRNKLALWITCFITWLFFNITVATLQRGRLARTSTHSPRKFSYNDVKLQEIMMSNGHYYSQNTWSVNLKEITASLGVTIKIFWSHKQKIEVSIVQYKQSDSQREGSLLNQMLDWLYNSINAVNKQRLEPLTICDLILESWPSCHIWYFKKYWF